MDLFIILFVLFGLIAISFFRTTRLNSKIKFMMTLFLIVGLVVCVLYRIPFNTHIDQTITGNVYFNGKQTEATVVEVKGSRSNYLFRDNQIFIGTFCIQYYERTCEEDLYVRMDWNKNWDIQMLLYSQNATFPSLELLGKLFINETMDEFAFGFKDGTVVATSEKMYHRYINEKF